MADDLLIEINDVVSSNIEKKITDIGNSAKYASIYVNDLANEIEKLRSDKGLSKVATAIADMNSKIIKSNEKLTISNNNIEKSNISLFVAREKGLLQIDKTIEQQRKLDASIEKSTQAIKRNEEAILSRARAESLKSPADLTGGKDPARGNGVIERRPQRQQPFNTEAVKQLDVGGQALRQLQAQIASEQKLLEINKKITEDAYNRLKNKDLTLIKDKAITSESQKQLDLAIARARASRTVRGALGDSAVGAVGTGFANSTKDIIENNKAVEKSNALYFRLGIVTRSVLIAQYTKQLLESTDAFTLINNRLGLVSDSLAKTEFLYKQLQIVANQTRSPIEDLARSFVRFDFALKELGASQTESIQFTKTIAQQLQISGLAVQEQSSALLQLSQALNKGKLDGDEFRTIMETIPTVATAIAKTMGVARGELIKLAPEGKITASVIREAMASIAEETDQAFKKLTPTIGQGFTVISNNTIDLIGNIKEFTGATEILAESLIFVGNNLKIFASIGVGAASIAIANFTKNMTLATTATKALNIVLAVNPIFLVAGAIGTVTSALILYRKELIVASEGNIVFADTLSAINILINPFNKELTDAQKKLGETEEGFFSINKIMAAFAIITRRTILFTTLFTDALGVTNELTDKIIDKEQELSNAREKGNKLREEEIDESKKLAIQLKNLSFAYEQIASARKTLNENNVVFQDTSSENAKIAEETEKFFDDQIIKLRSYVGEDLKIRQESALLITELEFLKIKKVAQARNPELAKRYLQDLELEKSILLGLNKDTLEYTNTLRVLSALMERRKITQEQYNDELNKTALGTKKLAIDEFISVNSVTEEYKKQRDELKKTIQLKIDFIEANKKSGLFGSTEEAQIQIDTLTDIMIRDLNKINSAKTLLTEEDIKRFDAIDKESEESANKILDRLQKEEDQRIKNYLDGIKRRKEEDEFFKENKKFGFDKEDQFSGINKQIEDAQILRDALVAIAEDRYRQEGVITKKGQEEIASIDKAFALKKSLLYAQTASTLLGVQSSMFASFSALAKEREGESSKSAKILFGISQGLAYGEAIVNMASAIAKANASAPAPQNIPAITFAATVGATQIANITSATLQGFREGGYVIGSGTGKSDSINARLSNGEFVINAEATARNRPLLENINSGVNTSNINNTYYGSGSGGSKGVVINNYTSAKVETVENDDGSLEVRIMEMVDAKLASDLSNGGGTSKASKAIHGLIKRRY